jgi:hypothetical protein
MHSLALLYIRLLILIEADSPSRLDLAVVSQIEAILEANLGEFAFRKSYLSGLMW